MSSFLESSSPPRRVLVSFADNHPSILPRRTLTAIYGDKEKAMNLRNLRNCSADYDFVVVVVVVVVVVMVVA